MSAREQETAEQRAERRRRTWSGGVARSFEELEQIELAEALRTTPADRIRAVTELVITFFDLRTDDGTPPRLPRSPGGVRALRG